MCTHGLMDGRRDGWTHGWKGWTDEWMKEWMDAPIDAPIDNAKTIHNANFLLTHRRLIFNFLYLY